MDNGEGGRAWFFNFLDILWAKTHEFIKERRKKWGKKSMIIVMNALPISHASTMKNDLSLKLNSQKCYYFFLTKQWLQLYKRERIFFPSQLNSLSHCKVFMSERTIEAVSPIHVVKWSDTGKIATNEIWKDRINSNKNMTTATTKRVSESEKERTKKRTLQE